MVVHRANGVVVQISQRGVVVHRAKVVWLFTGLVVWILTELKCFSQS